jgi:membrane protease YdiL (CAAX protease family)
MKNKIDFKPLLELVGLMIAGVLLGALATNALLPNLSESSASSHPVQFLSVVALSLIFSFGLPAFFWLKWRGHLARFDEPIVKEYKWYGLAFLLFITMLFVSEGAYAILTKFFESRGWTSFTEEPYNLKSVRDLLNNKTLLPATILVIAVVPAIAEEFFFRKVVFGFLHKQTNTFWIPALISSMFFAGLHNHALTLIPIFLLGLGLTYAYYVTRNIWVPILFHALNNSLSIGLVYAEVEESSSTHWTITLVASLLAAYLFLNWLPKRENEEDVA